MPLILDTDHQHPCAWLFTECDTPTGWACAVASAAHHHDTIAVGAYGPWADAARLRGWTVVETDLATPMAVDRLAIRLANERVRVFHPLVAMPTRRILPSTARLLAALGRSHATIERFVLGGSACVWRRRAHQWGVSDDTPTRPPIARRSHTYLTAENLALHAAHRVLIRLRAAPIWDAPERGLAKRLARPWIPQPKNGRPLLDPLCLEDFARAAAAAMAAPQNASAAVYGLPGPQTYTARALAEAVGTRILEVPANLSEALGYAQTLGWDRDSALVMAWSLTLSGVGARAHLGWEALDAPVLAQKKPA